MHRPISPLLALSLLSIAACEKKSAPVELAAPREAAPPASVVKPAESAVAVVAAAPAAAVASGSATAERSRERAGAKPPASASATPAGALEPASKHVAGDNYALDLSTPGCKADAECAVTIKLTTAGDWHVNKEYPYKFVASAAPNLTFLGTGDGGTFSRPNGDFVEQGEKVGVMTVRFRSPLPGEAHVAGTYKFSVCSAEQCQIEQEKVDLAVSVR
jgi:hypothetical protein